MPVKAIKKVRARARAHSYYDHNDPTSFDLKIGAVQGTQHRREEGNNSPTLWLAIERRGVDVAVFMSLAQLKALRDSLDEALAVAVGPLKVCAEQNCYWCKIGRASCRERV